MPRKFYLKNAIAAGKKFKQRKIRCDILTVQIEVGEGEFVTYPSLVLEDKSYEEVSGSMVYLPDEFGYPPPGAVRVSAVMTELAFGVLDNYQSGSDTEGEVPLMAIVDATAYWEDTGEPVDTMAAFQAQMAAEAEALAAQEAPADTSVDGSG